MAIIHPFTKAAHAVFNGFVQQNSATTYSTDIVFCTSLRAHFPEHVLTVVPETAFDLLSFAAAGLAKCTLNISDAPNIIRKRFVPPNRSNSEAEGQFRDEIQFARYDVGYKEESLIAYSVEVVEQGHCPRTFWYLLHKTSAISSTGGSQFVDDFIEAVARREQQLEKSILVFDRQRWTANEKLYKDVEKASWDDVVLDPTKKRALKADIEGFFDREAAYKSFLLHGKGACFFMAAMKTLSVRSPPIPPLYVKSLLSRNGNDATTASIEAVFEKARSMAPCLLIFEDLDSLISEKTRTYFLNEVDGLESNDGILMIGSTNNLDTLDPGLAKRPSRFDRKVFFDTPAYPQRVEYCEYWRKKLQSNDSLIFPESLSGDIARITDGFSFAYLKELFVTTLLSLANGEQHEAEWESVPDDSDNELRASILGRAVGNQVKLLRDEMADGLVKEKVVIVKGKAGTSK